MYLHWHEQIFLLEDITIEVLFFLKESLKVEMGIMEAKFESAQRTLEAELASQMEKEVNFTDYINSVLMQNLKR